MKLVLSGLICLAGCSASTTGPSAGDTGGSSGSGTGTLFKLTGSVTNPVSSQQSGRIVVGIALNEGFVPPIKCSSFIVKFDQGAVQLPTTYLLSAIPTGKYVLVAMLVDSSSSAPFAGYVINVENDGIHYNSSLASSSIDLVMQGTTPYECP